MKLILTYGPLLLCLIPWELAAQLSPGELTKAHAHLEGLSNCTKCHDIGNKVPDQKCLACHDEIQNLIDQDRGYHASNEVQRANCIDCHSEHHGRNFDMVRFDQENFDHTKTGYTLQGQHKVIDCRECHKPEFISDPEIRKRENTFLGLDQQCLSCHMDYHQNTLPNDCKQCHNFESFRPAPGFDHDDTDFALTGKHVEVDCISCHKETTRNDREFQIFSDVPHHDCKACHDDVHMGNFAAECKQCHTTEGFGNFVGQRSFDHNVTGFTLKGKHRQLDCFSCHQSTDNVLTIFQDNAGIEENQCIACHEDVHEGRFGEDCAKCHNEKSFLELNSMEFFDHSLTDYPLEGMHATVDCKECHKERYTVAIDFSVCKNCHDDYHEGEFADPPPSPDCAECHTVQGFEYTLFGLEEHQQTGFPLEGAHIATPCFACHLQEGDEKWRFTSLGTKCVNCHEDIHKDNISAKYYPEQKCDQCHVSESWTAITFDHQETGWPLNGRHLETACSDCHFRESEEGGTIQVFAGLSTTCTECHENIHGDQFVQEGITDCKRCHISNSWEPELFDHDRTAFPLEGRHAEIECKACHKTEVINGEEIRQFKMQSFECIDCHS